MNKTNRGLTNWAENTLEIGYTDQSIFSQKAKRKRHHAYHPIAAFLMCVFSVNPVFADTINDGQTVSVSDGSDWNMSGTLNVNGELNLLDGNISNTHGYLGQTSGQKGYVTVDGPNSTWTNNGNLTVGFRGAGELSITNGGVVKNTSTAYISRYADTTGSSVLVDGAGSLWETIGSIYVGNQGEGSLTISNGGTVNVSSALSLGFSAGSSAYVYVSGAGSSLNIGNFLSLSGSGGAGELHISDGASVTAKSADVGGYRGTGLITVDGNGSTLDITGGNLVIGKEDNASGTLIISNGGKVTSIDSYLGYYYTPQDNHVVISGTGSSWENSGRLNVGHIGGGTVTVADSATLSSNQSFIGGSTGGSSSGLASGTVLVSGVGSLWNNNIDIQIGARGVGLLTVENGGIVNSNKVLLATDYSYSEGKVVVTGNGSQLNVITDLVIADKGIGEIELVNRGSIHSGNAILGNERTGDATVNVNGTGTVWNTDNYFYIGNSGKATMLVDGAAVVNTQTAHIGRLSGGNGDLTVSGSGSMFNVADALYVGGTRATGVLTVSDGACAKANSATIGGVGSTGTITVTGNNSALIVTDELNVGESGRGELIVHDSGVVSAKNIYVGKNATGNGAINLSGGAMLETLSLSGGDGTGAMTFDNATLFAIGENDAFITGFSNGNIVIDAGGLTIDDRGYDIGTDSSSFSGSGSLTKTGLGTLTLSGLNTYSGDTQVASGQLKAGAENVFSSASSFITEQGTTLDLNGFNQTIANLNNSGIVQLGSLASTSPVGTLLTVNGLYESNGGSLMIRTILGDDASVTDKLIVDNVTIGAGGATLLYIENVGGLGDYTTGLGIQVVQVNGTAQSNSFVLGRPVTAGIYEYILNQEVDQSWYLQNYSSMGPGDTLYNPSIGAYLGNQAAATNLFMHSLYDKQGHEPRGSVERTSWGRIATRHDSANVLDGKQKTKTESNIIHLGSDIGSWSVNDGQLFVGLMGAYGDSKIKSTSKQTGTRVDGSVDGYSLGTYATWYSDITQDEGLYIDNWAQYSWFKNKITGLSQDRAEEKYDASLWTISTEVGYSTLVGKTDNTDILLAPHIQLTYNNYSVDDHLDGNLVYVSDGKSSGIMARLGARLYGKSKTQFNARPYLEANWLYNSAKNELNFDGYNFKDGAPKNRQEVKMGFEGAVAKNLTLWLQGEARYGEKSYHSYGGQFGVKYQW